MATTCEDSCTRFCAECACDTVLDWELVCLFPPLPKPAPAAPAAPGADANTTATATATANTTDSITLAQASAAAVLAAAGDMKPVDPWEGIHRPVAVQNFTGIKYRTPQLGDSDNNSITALVSDLPTVLVDATNNALLSRNSILIWDSVSFQGGLYDISKNGYSREFSSPVIKDRLKAHNIEMSEIETTFKQLNTLYNTGWCWGSRCCFRCCCDPAGEVEGGLVTPAQWIADIDRKLSGCSSSRRMYLSRSLSQCVLIAAGVHVF